MDRQFKRLLLLTLVVSLFMSFAPFSSSAYPSTEKPLRRMALHDAMRKLWEDHITWTRVFIISAAGDLPDKGTATDLLLQNQVDIGNAIKPYSAPLRGLFAHMKGGFYHDGRFAKLLDVVNHYNEFKKLKLSDQEKNDLVEYLKSL